MREARGYDLACVTDPVHENDGHCTVCERATRFRAEDAWLRDAYRCTRCGSIPRERALMLVLRREFPRWRRRRIHESSPGLPASRKLARECRRYVASHFFPDVAPGRTHRGFRCENLEAQTFPDGSFDLVVTQDVMEHVLDPAAAFREIARTLRPGGAHVFTTPIYGQLAETQVRARRRGDDVELLAEPEYHGNPIDAAGALVTVRFGRDLPSYVDRVSGVRTHVHTTEDASLGLLGKFLEVLVSRKPPDAEPRAVGPFWRVGGRARSETRAR